MTVSHDEPPCPRFEIGCVNKPDRQSLVEDITHIGGYGAGQWRLPVEEVIRRIDVSKVPEAVTTNSSHACEIGVASNAKLPAGRAEVS
jgi:hypothetical protein